jgi:hypothetical protein
MESTVNGSAASHRSTFPTGEEVKVKVCLRRCSLMSSLKFSPRGASLPVIFCGSWFPRPRLRKGPISVPFGARLRLVWIW